jgi:hypothetical protein
MYTEADLLDQKLSGSHASSEMIEDARVIYLAEPHDLEKEWHYALALALSTRSNDRVLSLQHLKHISGSSERYCKECMYYTAQVLYQDKKYSDARVYVEDLLRIDDQFNPNPQLIQLHAAITLRHEEQKVKDIQTKETLTTVGIVGGGLAVVGAALLFALGGSKKGNK